MASWYPVAENAIYIQEVIWIEDQGEGTPLSCTIHFSYFRTSFSFSLWLGEWDHFTRRTETFQMISNMYSYFFVHTLHCMGFQWVLGEEELHCVVRLGCCCYICKRWFLLIHRRGLLSSRGGGGGQTYWHQAYKANQRTGNLKHFTAHATGSPWSHQPLLCFHIRWRTIKT